MSRPSIHPRPMEVDLTPAPVARAQVASAAHGRPASLSVFFPMYNERDNIGRVLAEAAQVLPTLGLRDYEILVIDDGSQDGSGEVVADCARHNPHIRLVRHPRNLGYGAALRTGFASASREVVFYTDSDLPVDLREIAVALREIEHADLVIGYRVRRHETLRRAVYSRVYNQLMRWMFGVQVRDVNFSFKMIRREVLERISLTAGTVFIDGQLLAEAQRLGCRIVEIPVRYWPRQSGASSFDSLGVAWDTLREMVSYRLQLL
ncbi:MAG: glycosyltransferase family 2 protein [Myxococcales bacterium]|nr:glycosyltransferase family 2 protein [Myxococcota bacterium]MDW8282251.1 glycosyltransferase family 2 protein [Myxococcales bacterium]